MTRTPHLTPTDAGYVVSHVDTRTGEHIDTAVTLTQPLPVLELEDRGTEHVLPELANKRT